MKDDDLFAGWWRETMSLVGLARRGLPLGLLGGAALGAGGCADWLSPRPDENVEQEAQRADEVDRSVDALQLQRQSGWNVGRPEQPLAFPSSLTTDADGGQGWRTSMESMAEALAPSSAALRPWYVPTLFQSLIGPGGLGLRAVLRPIHTPEMGASFQRGLAIRQLFEQAGWPRDVAVVVDARGPESVAIGAALSDHFDPVFAFGNWPHPLGVVPSHQTLAAALFFQPLFQRERVVRPGGAPPVFVLDGDRLAPYTDEDAQFDNRYLVKLPDAQTLQAMGIHHVMYVSADGIHEVDDLNAQFVELAQKGVDVRMIGVNDFLRDDQAVALSDGEDEEDQPPIYLTVFDARPWFYFWGGDWWWQVRFWDHCGWGWVPHGGARPAHPPHGVTVAAPSGIRHPSTMMSARWSPTARATMFGSGTRRTVGVPGGFGQVTVRTARADGHVTGVRAGRTGSFAGGAVSGHAGSFSVSRSGSFGRSGGGGTSG
jgi:hypothetical protein